MKFLDTWLAGQTHNTEQQRIPANRSIIVVPTGVKFIAGAVLDRHQTYVETAPQESVQLALTALSKCLASEAGKLLSESDEEG